MVTRSSKVSLPSLLSKEFVRVKLPGEDKETVLNAMVDLVAGHQAVVDLSGVRRAVFDREAMLPTGVGKGLALPHAKTSAVRDLVTAFAITEQPIAFDAIDNEPVQLLFMLVSTERAKSKHIKLLSRVSRLMNDDIFRAALLNAASPEEVVLLFDKAEEALAAL